MEETTDEKEVKQSDEFKTADEETRGKGMNSIAWLWVEIGSDLGEASDELRTCE